MILLVRPKWIVSFESLLWAKREAINLSLFHVTVIDYYGKRGKAVHRMYLQHSSLDYPYLQKARYPTIHTANQSSPGDYPNMSWLVQSAWMRNWLSRKIPVASKTSTLNAKIQRYSLMLPSWWIVFQKIYNHNRLNMKSAEQLCVSCYTTDCGVGTLIDCKWHHDAGVVYAAPRCWEKSGPDTEWISIFHISARWIVDYYEKQILKQFSHLRVILFYRVPHLLDTMDFWMQLIKI